MDELFVLVYFLIILNLIIVLCLGYTDKNASYFDNNPLNEPLEFNIESDNIFIREKTN